MNRRSARTLRSHVDAQSGSKAARSTSVGNGFDDEPWGKSSRPLGVHPDRLLVLTILLAGFGLVLAGRLVQLQVVQHDRLLRLATDEHWQRTAIPAQRGDILDTGGHPLAVSVEYASLYAATAEIDHPDLEARRLAPVLGEPAADLARLLSARQTAPTPIRRWLPQPLADQIAQLDLPGLYLRKDSRREYPEGVLAAQLLGVVGVDGNGLSGIEVQWDQALAGRPGQLLAERDTAGEAIPFGARQYIPPTPGASVTLTIDRYVQWESERELDRAVASARATGGVVVVLDPRTGAVLALASRPTFDPNGPDRYSTAAVNSYPIGGVADVYEPGPLFGVFAAAAAIDAGTVQPDAIRGTADYVSWGPRLAAALGAEGYYRTLHAFGFGSRSGVDLPGESAGIVHLPGSPDWRPFELARNAAGQSIAVTPIQLAAGVDVLAGDGALVRPRVVREINGPTGRRAFLPRIAGRAVSPATAAEMSRELARAVDEGNGPVRGLRVPGYAVAGLCGSAPGPTVAGDNQRPAYATCLGYAPVGDARFTVLVRLDHPATNGADAAGAAAGSTIRALLDYYQIPSSATARVPGM